MLALILLLKQNDFKRRNYMDAKMSSFSSDFKHSLNIDFLCIFFMNY